MTTTPTSGAAIQRYKIGYHSDEWGVRSSTPSGIPDASGSWVRYADHVTALAAGQATKAAPTRTALPEGWTDCTIEFGNDGPEVVAYGPKRMMNRLAKWLGKYFAQVIADAATKAAPGEPSDADIDAFLDSPGGIEWVIADKRERYRLLVRAVLAKWAAPQQEAQEPCPTCAALARTVMLDQVSFDRKPDCYGIRQITDDEGVEEWEDIRTSPDVAREEANDMMATGRGEIYEVVPLWTTPQPAPDCHHRPPCDECAALAAQGGKDA